MSGVRLRRRLDRLAGPVVSEEIAPFTDPYYLEAVARWAEVSPIEVTTEARRIDALCQAARAQTQEARLEVVAAGGAVSVESLRAAIADLQQTLSREAT